MGVSADHDQVHRIGAGKMGDLVGGGVGGEAGLQVCLRTTGTACLLLQAGADPNWTMGSRSFGGNCLHEALMWSCDAAIIEALIEHGAQVDFADRDGRTPMAYAARLGRDDAREALSRHGTATGVSELDRWIAACWREDAAAARGAASS